jgi:hypothetical protein
MALLAADALTLLHPLSLDELRARLPRGPVTPDKVLIVECWEDCYPYRIMPSLRLQEDLLALYGPGGQGRLQASDVSTISFGDLQSWLDAPDDPAHEDTATALTDATWVLFALSEYNPDARPASGAVKRLLNASPIDLRNKNLVAIAYNVPYNLDSTEISKLAAYFAVYSKTQSAIDTSFRAIFGDVTPGGHAPVDVSGIFYDVSDAVQPDPAEQITVSLFATDPSDLTAGAPVGLVAGPVLDRNGNPVPDGTIVTFVVASPDGSTTTATGSTVDGIAGAAVAVDASGVYRATASVAGITSEPLGVEVGDGAPQPTDTDGNSTSGAGGPSALLLALAIGVPTSVIAGGAALGGMLVLRRRPAASPATVESPGEAPLPERVLRVDPETRRVYVKGVEAQPPLSGEQFRLLLYLYERAGKVIGRQELVENVWPEEHSEGVSEEALDALVRRVRERIVQAGGERSYIVTLRGQGFRLEV